MKTKIVGIINITPDSFSDGGRYSNVSQAIEHLRQMLQDGADIIDVGAESTRPNATAISCEEEWLRLEKIFPLISLEVEKYNRDIVAKDKSRQKSAVEISVDTRYASTAKRAYEVGAKIINDVTGLQNQEMVEFIAKKNIRTIFMHSLSVPANPDVIINKALNVVQEIIKWAEEKILYLQQNGIKKQQLVFDPGIGFSKDAEQSLRIIKNIEAFKILDLPIYVGHSKKSFLDILNIEGLRNDKESRSQKTLIISSYLARKNIDFIRVHDVLANKSAVKRKDNLIMTL